VGSRSLSSHERLVPTIGGKPSCWDTVADTRDVAPVSNRRAGCRCMAATELVPPEHPWWSPHSRSTMASGLGVKGAYPVRPVYAHSRANCRTSAQCGCEGIRMPARAVVWGGLDAFGATRGGESGRRRVGSPVAWGRTVAEGPAGWPAVSGQQTQHRFR